jgi:hypothetical protein
MVTGEWRCKFQFKLKNESLTNRQKSNRKNKLFLENFIIFSKEKSYYSLRFNLKIDNKTKFKESETVKRII